MSASYLHDFVTDSALLGPAAPPLREVVKAHAVRRGSSADPTRGDSAGRGVDGILGALVLPDRDLPAFQGVIDELALEPVDVVVHVSGGAGAIEPAVRWAARQSGIRLVGLAVAVRDLDDLARGAHRVAAMVMQLDAEGLLEDTRTEVTLPLYGRTEGASRWQHALDTLAMEDLTLGLRTGGVDADDDVPLPRSLAGAIGDALDREVPFTCNGGPVHAVARHDEGSGVLRHGFLNVLLATRASLDGDDVDTVAERLAADSVDEVVGALTDVGTTGLQSARRWFVGFASHDVDATLADIDGLDGLTD